MTYTTWLGYSDGTGKCMCLARAMWGPDPSGGSFLVSSDFVQCQLIIGRVIIVTLVELIWVLMVILVF